MGEWYQLFFLILFLFTGLILASAILIIAGGGSIEKMQSIDFLRIMQLLQAILLFLFPACLCAYLFSEQPLSYLKLNKQFDFKFLLMTLLLMLVVQPFISFVGYYNNLMTLPESLSEIEQWMRQTEDSTQALMERMLTTDSVGILLLNIFVIAIIAGLTEEFFFRGSLQQIFNKITNNKHIAIWITAFIFSAIHFQFYGFFPRLILGAILGYIFLWSGNLWISVIAHTFNNLMSVLMFHFTFGTPMYEEAQNFGASADTIVATIISVIVSGIILYFLSKEFYKNKLKNEVV